MELLATVPLLIIDDLGMRKLGPTAGEELLEIVMRRYERASTLLTSNLPVEDWGKLLGDSAAVTAMLDRLLHHGLDIQLCFGQIVIEHRTISR
jgi:DNA replication protein DnaC